jgi:heme/copper-type cytochrome/quinol oxidase subunit 2
MNKLTILLYLMDALESMSMFIWFGIIATAIAAVCTMQVYFAKKFNPSTWRTDQQTVHAKEIENSAKRASFWFIGTFIVLVFLSILIPSTQTLYLMAGSEVGEMAATSERGEQILNKIEMAIDAQLDKLIGTPE